MRAQLSKGAHVKEEVFNTLIGYRRKPDNKWITWLTHTKTQARFALPDDHDFPEDMAVRSKRGWTTLKVTSEDEAAEAERLLQERLTFLRQEEDRGLSDSMLQ